MSEQRDEGMVLYVRPKPDATTSPQQFSREGLARFSTGLTIDDPVDGTFVKTEAGEYEVRAYDSEDVRAVEMVATYYFWDITRRVSWEDWDRENLGH